jgi:hypothetical protein
LEEHARLLAERGNAPPTDLSTYERCLYTEAVSHSSWLTTRLETVQFSDATASFFGEAAANFHGPVGVIDINHRGTNDLFLREGTASFRLLMNEGATTPGRSAARRAGCDLFPGSVT